MGVKIRMRRIGNQLVLPQRSCIINHALLMVAGLVMMVGLSATLQWVLELE
jgi:hypothetical protein